MNVRMLAGGLVAVLLAACAISRQREISMGADYARQIEAQLPVVHTTEIDAYLDALGDSGGHIAVRHRRHPAEAPR